MADLSDVETALVGGVVSALYPAGLGNPCRLGSPVRVFRGWPPAEALTKDLDARVSNVSVSTLPEGSRNTTRWASIPAVSPGTTTLQATVNGTSVTFSGQAGTGQVAGVLVDGKAFAYRGNTGDTPALVAAVLAEQVKEEQPCWLSGATLTVPGAGRVVARVVGDGTTTQECMRQEQCYRVSAFCPSPEVRDAVCGAITQYFASVAFIDLADGSQGRVRYRSTTAVDDAPDGSRYRRDTLYDVEFGVTTSSSSASMLFGGFDWMGQSFVS